MHSAEGTVEQYAPSMTSIDLNRFRLRPGETRREEIEVEVLPFLLGGERYEPAPARLPAVLVASEASGGTLFTLESSARLSGPCMRCLGPAHVGVEISAREFHDPDGGEGLRSDYVVDDRLELTAWARDSIGVELPDGQQPFVQICLALLQAELNVHYTYPLLYHRSGRGAIALYVDDVDLALKTLEDKGLHIVTESDLLADDDMF